MDSAYRSERGKLIELFPSERNDATPWMDPTSLVWDIFNHVLPQVQQIKAKLVEIDIEFNSAYTANTPLEVTEYLK